MKDKIGGQGMVLPFSASGEKSQVDGDKPSAVSTAFGLDTRPILLLCPKNNTTAVAVVWLVLSSCEALLLLPARSHRNQPPRGSGVSRIKEKPYIRTISRHNVDFFAGRWWFRNSSNVLFSENSGGGTKKILLKYLTISPSGRGGGY